MGVRPHYERITDREFQGVVAAEIGEAWDCEVIPMPPFSAADFLFVSRTLGLALGEMKHRSNPRDLYPTLIISSSKLERITAAADALQLPFFLFIQWSDGLFWRRIHSHELAALTSMTGGRKDRGDPKDTETVFEIPAATFRPLRKAFWDIEDPGEARLQ